MGIVVIGTSFVDVKGFPESSYIPNKRQVGRVDMVHGGVARNVAVNIANMKYSATLITTVDESPLGRDVIEKLMHYKVNTEHIIAVENGLGTWMAIFDEHGDVAVSVAQRPDTYPLLAVLEEAGDQIFAACDAVVFEMDMHIEIVNRIFSLAKKYGKTTYSVVSNIKKAIDNRVFCQPLDYLICNEVEAGLLFSKDFKNESCENMQKVLLDRIQAEHISAIIVTRGEKGAVFADIEGNTGKVKAENVAVMDTTGAGDAFCAGVVTSLTYGKSITEAIQIGNHLAASVVTSVENVFLG